MNDVIYTELSVTEQISTLLQSEIETLSNDVSSLSDAVNYISVEHDQAVDYLDSKMNNISSRSEQISAYAVKDNSSISELDLTTELNDEDLYIVSQPSPDTDTGYISKHILFRDIKTDIISSSYLCLDIDLIHDEMDNIKDEMSKIDLHDHIEISCRTDPPGAYIISSIVEEKGNLISCSGYLFKNALANQFHASGPEPYISGYYAPISSDYQIGETLKTTKVGDVTTGTPSHSYELRKLDISDKYKRILDRLSGEFEPADPKYKKELGLYKVKTNEFGQVIQTERIDVDIGQMTSDIGQITATLSELSAELSTKQNLITPENATVVESPYSVLLKSRDDQDDFKYINFDDLLSQLSSRFISLVSHQSMYFADQAIENVNDNIIKNASLKWMFNDPQITSHLTSQTLLNKPFLSNDFSLRDLIDSYNSISNDLDSTVDESRLETYTKMLICQDQVTDSAINTKSYLRVSIPFTHRSLVSLRFDYPKLITTTTSQLLNIKRLISLITYSSAHTSLIPNADNKFNSFVLHPITTFCYIGNGQNYENPLIAEDMKYVANKVTTKSTSALRTLQQTNLYNLHSRQCIIDAGQMLHIVIPGNNATLYDANNANDPFAVQFANTQTLANYSSLFKYGPATKTDTSNTTNTTTSYAKKGCLGVPDLLQYLKLHVIPLI